MTQEVDSNQLGQPARQIAESQAEMPIEARQIESGRFLGELRKSKGLSMLQLASKAKLDPSTINRIERGIFNPPRFSTVRRLTDALGLDDEARQILANKTGWLPGEANVAHEIQNAQLPEWTEELVFRTLSEQVILARRHNRPDIAEILLDAEMKLNRLNT